MTLEQFQQYIADGRPLRGEEMINFMRDSSDEVRRLLMELNCHYHTDTEIRALFAQITVTMWTTASECFRRSTPISGETYTWGAMFS